MHSFVIGAADTFDVVQAQGPDAVRFLQGQLTCDVVALENNAQTYGACCNNKGRVIAGFTIVRISDVFYLCMAHGLGAALVEALRKYLPFYKCELILNAAGHQLVALAGASVEQMEGMVGTKPLESGQALPVGSGWLCKLEGQPSRALWWGDKTLSEIASTFSTFTAASLEQWETLGLLNGHYPLRQSDTGLYTPQELYYNQNGYVSFSKGCYTGQEIVARMHYRGKPKKQLCLAKLAHKVTLPEPGQQLHITDQQNHPVGICRLSCSSESLHLALIELSADFSGDFSVLQLAGLPVLAGCAFEAKVTQFSHFI